MAETHRFLVLHALKVKGLAPPGDVAGISGLTEVDPVLEELAADGLAKLRAGRVGGWTLTPAGREAYPDLAASQVDEVQRAGVAKTYDGFLPVNGRFKDLCTRWQVRPGPEGASQPNDHADAAYDAAVVEDLVAVHGEVLDVLEPAAAAAPRFAGYPNRFGAALARLRGGDVEAFARPMTSSYHDVWMELHEDLLLTLGRERDTSDGH